MAYQSEIELRVKVLDKELKDLERQIDKVQSRGKAINPFAASGASRENKKALDLQQKLMAAEKARLSVDKNRLQLNLDLNQQRIKSINLNTSWYKALQTGKQIQLDINKAVAKEVALRKQATAKRRARRGEDLALGVGFPLLFGGGVGSVVGGAAGALAGGGKGGFGLQILGSAIGQQVDAFVQAASEAGVALTSTGGALDLVREKSLFSTKQNKELAAQLEEQGDAAGLAKLLTEELVGVIGNTGVEALGNLGTETQETTRLWNELTLQLQALIAGPLTDFLKIVNQFLGEQGNRARLAALQKDLAGTEAGGQLAAEIERLRPTSQILQQGETRTIKGVLDPKDVTALLEKFTPVRPPSTGIPVTAEDRRSITRQTNTVAERTRRQNQAATNRLAISRAELRIAKEISELSKIDLEFDLESIKVKGRYAKLISKALSDQEKETLEKAQKLDLELLSVERNEKISNYMRDQFQSAMQLNDELLQVVPKVTELSDEFKSLANTINNEIINGIEGMIDGTKTLGQVASSMLKQIASQMLQTAIMGPSGSGGIAGMIFGALGIGGGGGFKSPSVLTSGLDFSGAFASGGRPPVGKAALVGERGPELFVPRSSGTIVPNSAMGGSTNVVVNVDAKGTAAQGDDAQAGQLGRLIGAAVQAELVKQKRPGGLLTR